MAKALTDLDEIKVNIQEVGGRIKNSFNNLSIPMQVYQRLNTAGRRAGVYIERVDFDEFIELELRWHEMEDLTGSKSFKDMSALWQSVNQVREGLSNDLQLLYNLLDQFTLLQASKQEKIQFQKMLQESQVRKESESEAVEVAEPSGVIDAMVEPPQVEKAKSVKKKSKGKTVAFDEDADEDSDEADSEDEE